MRSEVKRLLPVSCENYFSSNNVSFSNNPKRFWTVLKQKSKTCSIPDCISMPPTSSSTNQIDLPATRSVATNPSKIAAMFNAYFASVFTFDDQSDQPKVSTSDPVITELTLSEDEVELTLKSFDINKAAGPDGIPAKFLKETASIIAPSLCKLFNKSLHQGAVPEEWKLANVVPVFKKGDNRFISLLSIVSKVLERRVFLNIKHHLWQLTNKCQHGFLQSRSCVTNLLEVFDYIGEIQTTEDR